MQACLSMHVSDEAPVSGRAGAANRCIANRHVRAELQVQRRGTADTCVAAPRAHPHDNKLSVRDASVDHGQASQDDLPRQQHWPPQPLVCEHDRCGQQS